MIKNKSVTEQTPWQHEEWIKSKWRPLMAYVYMAICVFDFILAPLTRIWFSIYTKTDLVPWQSLTLSEGGLFHLSMGTILGVAAWTRGQEKIRRVEYGSMYMNYDDDENHDPDAYRRNPRDRRYAESSPTPPPEMTGN